MSLTARPGLPAAFLVVLLASFLPALAAAEGNRLQFDCEALPPPASEPVDSEEAPLPASPAFTLAPVKTDRDGAGAFQVTGPDGGPFAGVASSFSGPFAWTAGTVLHTLTVQGTIADGRTSVLWHRLDQAQTTVPPVGRLTKLICEVS